MVQATIDSLMQHLRGFINKPRKLEALVHDSANWNMLCSSMDLLEDTDLAVDSFLTGNFPDDDGARYLIVYGLLQALFVQQDALKHLHQSLNLEFRLDEDLLRVRDLRNDSIGHPSKRVYRTPKKRPTVNDPVTYNFISRITLSKDGFQLMTVSADQKDPIFHDVDLNDLIDAQRVAVATSVQKVIDILRNEEIMHRAQFRDDKLAALFPDSMHYHFEKIVEAISDDSRLPLGQIHVRYIAGIVESFRSKLVERGTLHAYSGVNGVLTLLDYPLTQLGFYMNGSPSSTLNSQSAYIFAYFIQHHLEELKQMAVEIDKEYENEP